MLSHFIVNKVNLIIIIFTDQVVYFLTKTGHLCFAKKTCQAFSSAGATSQLVQSVVRGGTQ